MKRSTALLFLALFLSGFIGVRAQQQKFSSVKITPPASAAERNELLGLLEIDHFYYDTDGDIVSEISADAVQRLKTSGKRYRVLVEDVAARLREQNRRYEERKARGELPATSGRLAFEQTGRTVDQIIPTPAAFEVKSTYGGYYSFAEMNTAMNQLVAAYPTLAQKTSLGKSVDNRDIWCIKISDNVTVDETSEPEVLFMGLQHAREAIGGSSLIFFMQYLCENYATDSRVRDLVQNRQIYIVPCTNPDGWEYNRTNGGEGSGWRKNRKLNSGGSYGVDLNRNYGVDWGNCSGATTSCGSATQSADTYYGTAAFSEPETKAIRDFTYTRRFVAMIDQHAFGPYYSLPFGRPSLHTTDMAAWEKKFYTYVPASMGHYNGMRAGNSPESVGYEVAGGIKDWMLMGNIGTGTKGKVYGMTGEGGAGGGTGGSYGSFWAPAEEIANLCKGMTFQNLQLLLAAGSYVNLQDVSGMNVTTKNTTLNYNITRVGLANQPVKVSIVPIENMETPATSNTTSLTNYFDTYTGGITVDLKAAITNGQRFRFAWKVETGGITYYDTVTKFYNATSVMTDNMEGTFATNWTSADGWGFTAAGTGYGGTGKALSESPSGNYTSSSTRICTYNNSISLTGATAAYINFWVRHRAENFHDKLQLQVSIDAGANWTAIAGTTTIQEPGTLDGSTIDGQPSMTGIREDWTRETFDLKNYLGASALRLRFVFTSDANDPGGFDYQVDDGFYIDNFSIFKTNATLVTLPVDFISFTGKLTPQKTVELEWKAVVDAQHSHFEIERSTDGQHYTSIGTVVNPPYVTTDPSPASGLNYYRIKHYDIDGSFTYSTIVTIFNDHTKFVLSLYPNPAKEDVTLRFAGARPEKLLIEITDLSGRLVYQQTYVSGNNGNELKIDVRPLASQMYFLKVSNMNKEILSKQKFIKQ